MGATLRDVAALAGVSPATASLALNNKPVKETTRQKVLLAARKLNYQPHYGGRVLATGRSHVIGLYVFNDRPEALNTAEVSFFYPILRGIMEVVSSAGYAFQFGIEWVDAKGGDSVLNQKMNSGSLDGIIALPQWPSSHSILGQLDSSEVPSVVINPVVPLKNCGQIVVDNLLGAELAITHLHSLGYEEIGAITGPPDHIDSIHRAEGLYRTTSRLGVTVREEWVEAGDFGTRSGYLAMKRILRHTHLPRAMFAFNDYMATGAMHAVLEAGLSIPDDIAFVGFDDIEVASAIYPKLTTVRQHCFELGCEAAKMLLDDLEGKTSASKIKTIKPTLVIRDSCGGDSTGEEFYF
jgi:DNA-binding LacI/PurR family transcriptional regulator